MSIEAREVRMAEHFGTSMALARENWAETGFDFELAPDLARYQALEDAGVLLTVAAFEKGTVIGYAIAYVAPHMFNPAVVCCLTEALFVQKAYRHGWAALLLIAETERVAKERGASQILWSTRAGTPLAGALLQCGYAEADVVVMKELEHGRK